MRRSLKYLPCTRTRSNPIILNLKRFAICCLGSAVVWLGQARAADWLHAGLLYDHFQLTLQPGERTEALGPFFYTQESDTEKTWAIPPLFSEVKDPAVELHEYDFVYPVLTYRRYGTEHRWQLMQLLSFAGGENQAEQKAKRFTLFPLYFRQTSRRSPARTIPPWCRFTAISRTAFSATKFSS